jgi:hypothetical protein
MPFGSTAYRDAAPNGGSAASHGGGSLQALFDAFKWPLLGAGITLFASLLWLAWPDGEGRVDGFDMVDAITPAVADQLILDNAEASRLDNAPLVAAHHIVVRGNVRLPADTVLAADSLTFDPDARIDAPGGRLIALAPHIENAAIDLSGRNGTDGVRAGAHGADGETGGIALIAAARFDGGRILANGGNGGAGARGYTGAAGRNGWCGPRSFGLAQRGATGGPGGAAGNGGSGGLITLLYQQQPVDAAAVHGRAGDPGRGGNGGRGGAGCKGLRGNQPNQPPGNEGPRGRTGSRGDDGAIDRRKVDFDEVAEAFEDWLDTKPRDFGQLRDRLLAIEATEPR